MTKIEAKAILEKLLQEESDLSDGLSDDGKKVCDQNIKALDMAIKSLEGIKSHERDYIFHDGYMKGYRRAMLDYGLED